MSKLDREYQRKILLGLRETFPDPAGADEIQLDETDERWTFNCMYLHQHGLIEADVTQLLSVGARVHSATITAAGLDFLEDDGGLTAILGVLTVRLEADTIRALMAAKIEASALPPEEKSALKKKLQELGGDALSAIAKRLLDASLDQVPDAFRLLQSMLG